MEQDPNLFAQGQAGQRAMEKTMAPAEVDTPRDVAAKRRALQRWYRARSEAARRHYQEWMARRSLERKAGTSDVNKVGQYALDKVVKIERHGGQPLPARRFEVLRLWQRLLRRRGARQSVEGGDQYARSRRMPWSDRHY